jgi:hypothetical protein
VTEDKKVITIDDVEYTEDQLSDEAKACINHISRLDGKLNAAKLNVIEIQRGRDAFFADLKAHLESIS